MSFLRSLYLAVGSYLSRIRTKKKKKKKREQTVEGIVLEFIISLLLDHLSSDLDITKDLDVLELFLDEFERVDDRRDLSAKEVGNDGVELVGAVTEHKRIRFELLEFSFDLGEHAHSHVELVLAELSERHLLDVKVHALHGRLEHLHIKDQRHQLAHTAIKDRVRGLTVSESSLELRLH